MKCIVKACEQDVFMQDLCEEHYDPEKHAAGKEGVARQPTGGEMMPLRRRITLLIHTALLISGKVAGRLVQGYTNLFSLSAQERAEILDYLATADLKKGRETRSLAAFENAARLDPANPAVHFRLGEAYLVSERFEEACASLERALELDSESPEANQRLGEAYYNREDFKAALSCLQKAHQSLAQSEKLNYLIGLTHDKLGSFKNAVKFLQAAVDINPRSIEYYYSLGFVYESHGDKDEALASFKKAVELEKAKCE